MTASELAHLLARLGDAPVTVGGADIRAVLQTPAGVLLEDTAPEKLDIAGAEMLWSGDPAVSDDLIVQAIYDAWCGDPEDGKVMLENDSAAFICATRDGDELRLEVGYYDHAGYTRMTGADNGDGGAVRMFVSIRPTAEDWAKNGLVGRLVHALLDGAERVQEMTAIDPEDAARDGELPSL